MNRYENDRDVSNGSMTSSAWQSFLPQHIVTSLAANPTANPVGQEQRFQAVVLFADVSGFTAISEALGQSGKRGSEELTAILNRYFEPMIALIRSYGGIIGRFGGDAMTVIFPFTAENRAQVSTLALQCALEMQAKMTAYQAIQTSAGVFGLRMKAGLAAGPVLTVVVGVPGLRLDYAICGSALDWCAEAEHHATSGEVVIHASLRSQLPAGLALLAESLEDPGFTRMSALAGFSASPGAGSLISVEDAGTADTPALVQTIQTFLHPSINQRVLADQLSFLNEHRKVTVLFVRFEGEDYDQDPRAGEKLQAYLARVITVVDRYGGYLNKVDMGDKGSKYIILFGAPIAHEDDIQRALRCALELRDLDGPAVRIGVNSGFVYSGRVGSSRRQEYTVMGDVVNTAARLMQAAAPGEVLVTAATQAASNSTFAWESPRGIQAKGKSEPLQVVPLRGLLRRRSLAFQEIHYELPLVGRDAEMLQAVDIFEYVLQFRQGRILGLTAEAGMGKSRFAADLVERMVNRGFKAFGGECLSHGTTTNYLVWQPLLRSFFHLVPSAGQAEPPAETGAGSSSVERLAAELARINPDLVARMPLLAALLNLDIPENELTARMDAKLRKSSREALVVEAIRTRAAGSSEGPAQPLLLILEDCHWLDPLSNDLLEVVARNIADLPVLVLVIYRPPEMERIQPRVRDFPHFREVRLGEFTSADTEKLIFLKLQKLFGDAAAGAVIPAELVEQITQRSNGNPFFIDEMINWMRDQDIRPEALHLLKDVALPDSLRGLIISRIDRLPEDVKITLKVASVIGRLFRASWLWGVYPKAGTPDSVKHQLEALSRLDITPLDKPEPELEYLFKHILTRDVAYESLAVATRTMLHGAAGEYFESRFEALGFTLDFLAYHYGLSEREDKKRLYFQQAAQTARQAYANQTALDYYQRLLPLLDAAHEQAQVLYEIGKIQVLVGQWAEAEATCTQGLALAESMADPFWLARFRGATGSLLYRKGAFVEALDWLTQARDGFTGLQMSGEAADCLNEIGVVYWYQGDYEAALQAFDDCQQMAAAAGNTLLVCRTLGNMGTIYASQGQPERALEAYRKGQALASEQSDRLNLAILYSNMGAIQVELGDYTEALKSYVRSLQLGLEIGYRQGVGVSVGNLGDLYLDQGLFAESLACSEQNLKISLELGDQMGVSFALWKIGRASLYQADGPVSVEVAQTSLQFAVDLGRKLEIDYDLCDYLLEQAALFTIQRNYTAALAAAQEAVEFAAGADRPSLALAGQALALRLQAWQGSLEPAAAMDSLVALLDNAESDEDQALLHYEIVQVDPAQSGSRAQAAALYQSLYTSAPKISYRQRYREMVAANLLPGLPSELPLPPFTLPPLPDVVTRSPANLSAMFAQVKALLAS